MAFLKKLFVSFSSFSIRYGYDFSGKGKEKDEKVIIL